MIYGDRCDAEPRLRALVADHDPVSRRILGEILGRSKQVEVVASVDSHDPSAEWPLTRIDVAVVDLGSMELPVDPVAALVSAGVRVLVVGVDWTQHTVAAALGAGVTGCLAKDPEFVGVAGSLQAVATGAMVMSPELLSLWLPRPRSSSEGRSLARLDKLTVRERQVLTLLSEGLSTDETARSCGVSPVTIKSHVSHALAKLGARNRLEAVLMVREALVANNGPGGARRGRHVAEV